MGYNLKEIRENLVFLPLIALGYGVSFLVSLAMVTDTKLLFFISYSDIFTATIYLSLIIFVQVLGFIFFQIIAKKITKKLLLVLVSIVFFFASIFLIFLIFDYSKSDFEIKVFLKIIFVVVISAISIISFVLFAVFDRKWVLLSVIIPFLFGFAYGLPEYTTRKADKLCVMQCFDGRVIFATETHILFHREDIDAFELHPLADLKSIRFGGRKHVL